MTNKYYLSKLDCVNLERKAFDLLIQNKMVCFPIDIVMLAIRAFNADVINYSSLSKEKLDGILQYEELQNGFTITEDLSDGTKHHRIYYNDNCCIERQRFTIAHELKHIYYGEKTYDLKQEKEAEYFASVLLAPPCIAIVENKLTINKEHRFFKISNQAAQILLQRIDNRQLKYGKSLFDYEQKFLSKRSEIINCK